MPASHSPAPGPLRESLSATAPTPWWRYGHVWLVIAGPVAAVLVGLAMLAAALSQPDPVVAADYYRRGIEINKTLAAGQRKQLPAMLGRNHAATPATPAAPVPAPSAQP